METTCAIVVTFDEQRIEDALRANPQQHHEATP